MGAVLAGAALILTTYFCLEKSVTINVDNQVITQNTFENTVEGVLKEKQIVIGPQDLVVPGLDQALQDDLVITVSRAFPVSVAADGKTQALVCPPLKVADLLEKAGIKLGDKDMVSANLNSLTHRGQVIKVTRVEEKEIIESVAIPYGREYSVDNNLEVGLTRTISRGINGTANQLVKVTYHDGKEVARQLIKSEMVKAPVAAVVARGTISAVSRGGVRLDFSRAMVATATAYTYTGNRTATGTHPAVGQVAVDPRVIPMGARLYVEGYGYAVATDRGSAIKGDKIDVFLESTSACNTWGRRSVKVYVLQ